MLTIHYILIEILIKTIVKTIVLIERIESFSLRTGIELSWEAKISSETWLIEYVPEARTYDTGLAGQDSLTRVQNTWLTDYVS